MSGLLVISRGRFTKTDTGYQFQAGDGPYLDSLAVEFDLCTVVSSKVDPQQVSNETYAFQNPVKFVDRNEFGGKRFITRLTQLRALIKAHEVVFLFYPLQLSLPIALMARLMRKKVIAYNGGYWSEIKTLNDKPGLRKTLKTIHFNLLESLSVKLSHRYLTNNNTVLKKYSGKSKVIKAVPLLKIKQEDLYERTISPSKIAMTFLCVSHIKPGKGMVQLINAFSQFLSETQLRHRLVFVGEYAKDITFFEELAHLANELGIKEQIRFTGVINEKQILLQQYRDADALILASESEGFPRVIWEAFSQSLPVISTALPNILMEFDQHDLPFYAIKDNSPERIKKAFEDLTSSPRLRRDFLVKGMNHVKDRLANSPGTQFMSILNLLSH